MTKVSDLMAKRAGKGPILADYDGTWTDHPEIRKIADGIVTGASFEEKGRVMEGNNIDVPVYYNPAKKKDVNFMNIVGHKAKVINDKRASVFYENDPQIAARLKKLCPDCEIKLI